MCNCGKKRNQYSQQSHSPRIDLPGGTAVKTNPAYTTFEYTGKTALTIIGNVTGIKYRFSSPGNTQNINLLDTPGMMAVPVLRKVL